jgi:hypothetical protein
MAKAIAAHKLVSRTTIYPAHLANRCILRRQTPHPLSMKHGDLSPDKPRDLFPTTNLGIFPYNKLRVPHISLVFREMWDTTGLIP